RERREARRGGNMADDATRRAAGTDLHGHDVARHDDRRVEDLDRRRRKILRRRSGRDLELRDRVAETGRLVLEPRDRLPLPLELVVAARDVGFERVRTRRVRRRAVLLLLRKLAPRGFELLLLCDRGLLPVVNLALALRELLARRFEFTTHRRALAFELREALPSFVGRALELRDLRAALVELVLALRKQGLEAPRLVGVAGGRGHHLSLRQALDLGARLDPLLIEIPPRLLELLPRAVELVAQPLDLLGIGRVGRLETHGSIEARRLAIKLQRHRGVLRHAATLLVKEPEVDLRAGVALIGGLAVPERGLLVVRRSADATLVDFAEIRLSFLVALLGRRLPDLQRRCIVGAVVGDVFAAADLAVGDARSHRPARRQVRHARSELAHLSWQQAVDGQQAIGLPALVARRRLGDGE